MCSAVASAGRRLPWQATVAPPSASAMAMAAPRPLAAPVTRAVFPSRRKRSTAMRGHLNNFAMRYGVPHRETGKIDCSGGPGECQPRPPGIAERARAHRKDAPALFLCPDRYKSRDRERQRDLLEDGVDAGGRMRVGDAGAGRA